MPNDGTIQRLLFPEVFGKPVVAQFDEREGTSDVGALLLKAADRHYGLVTGLVSCLRDERQAVKCIVPAFDGANYCREWKKALWAKYCTGRHNDGGDPSSDTT